MALLAAGADPAARTGSDQSPWDLVQYNAAFEGTDVYLHLAAAFIDNPSVIATLIGAGAGVGARDKGGLTPLHYAAAWSKNPSMIAALVDAGADVGTRDKDGLTPLHAAARWNESPAVVMALLAAGADPAARTGSGQSPWDLVQDNAALEGTVPYWLFNDARFR